MVRFRLLAAVATAGMLAGAAPVFAQTTSSATGTTTHHRSTHRTRVVSRSPRTNYKSSPNISSPASEQSNPANVTGSHGASGGSSGQ